MGQGPNWAAPVPYVNGHLYSHASIECDIDGLLFAGITSINYDDPVQPGKLYGTGGVLVGRTPGTSKPTLSLTMLRRDWDVLRAQLSGTGPSDGTTVGTGSYGTKSFDVRVTYYEEATLASGVTSTPTFLGVHLAQEAAFGSGSAPTGHAELAGPPAANMVMDVIAGVRVTGVAQQSAEGSSPTTVVLACDPWLIRWGSGDGRDGITNLAPDDPNGFANPNPSARAAAGMEGPEPLVGDSQVDAGTGEWWYATDDGFEGRDYPDNPWDGFIIAGMRLPGLCKTTATPSQMVDRQKPNGADAAALIIRGYSQAEIEIEVTIWMRSHWSIWQQFTRKYWRRPNKASVFEKPDLKKAAVKGAGPDNKAIIKERAAIDRSKSATIYEAQAIYHPALADLGICTALITSISAPVPGPQPQTFVCKLKMVEYVWAPDSAEASRSKPVKGASTGVEMHPKFAGPPGSTTPVANAAGATPADTEGGPE
jgi:hypothetical protein